MVLCRAHGDGPHRKAKFLEEPEDTLRAAVLEVMDNQGHGRASKAPTARNQGRGRRAIGGARSSLNIVVGFCADHQRFADFFGPPADGAFDPFRDAGIVLQELLGVFATLADPDRCHS